MWLSVNEKFVAHGKMVKILATLKSSCAKACYLIQNLKPAIESVYLPQCLALSFFFHSLACWRYEGYKK